jgi:hypothetical protein
MQKRRKWWKTNIVNTVSVGSVGSLAEIIVLENATGNQSRGGLDHGGSNGLRREGSLPGIMANITC